MTSPQDQPELLQGPEPEADYSVLRQDAGGMVTNHNGVADRLLRNNDLYRAMKGDWRRTTWNGNRNIKTTTGRQGGEFFIQREQQNVQDIARQCQAYRAAAEAGVPDPLAPIMDDGKLGWKWMELPLVISTEISDRYFGGMPWSTIKHDRTLKAQFYRVVEREYNQFVCYPGGRLPIPVEVSYPVTQGQQKFFQGHRQ